jgi:Tfp pilus assembly protein PilF
MSKTLNLVECLLAMGRNYQVLGRHQDALHLLGRLASFRELRPEVAEEAQARLAEIHLGRDKYVRARRHLSAALTYRPDSKRYHHLMATAHDRDEKGDPQTALEHYRKSLELDPDQPRCLSDFGILAVYLGQSEEGLQALRRAVELAPDDVDATGKLVEGLCLVDQPDEARRTLRAALFRNSRNPRFRKLWNDFQFQQLHDAQQAAQTSEQAGREGSDEPVLLPFVRPAQMSQRGKVIRQDGASSPAPPHTPRPTSLPNRRHA